MIRGQVKAAYLLPIYRRTWECAICENAHTGETIRRDMRVDDVEVGHRSTEGITPPRECQGEKQEERMNHSEEARR